ncbi:MAG TPA: penicillin-binding protein 2 [Synergistales bacterium]|nr:penicillin-binding protein 2 [Synergistales bacterium]
MPDKNERIDRRLFFSFIGMFAFCIILAFSLGFFQLVESDRFGDLASENRLRFLRIPPERGEIFDRNGAPLGINLDSFNIMGYPLDIRKSNLLPSFARLLNSHGIPITREDLEKRIEQQFLVPYRSLPLLKDLTLTQMIDLVGDPLFPEQLFPLKVSHRSYPAGPLVAHVMGYVGEISPEELKNATGYEYSGGDLVGKNGIERQHEELLRGLHGEQAIEVDARGRKIRTLDITPPTKGEDLHLTLDLGAQSLAGRLFEGKRGAAIALDVNTGEILVLYSSPGYDNNPLTWGVSPAEWRALMNNPERPMMNRTISGLYSPGSVFKPLVALAALDKGVISSSTRFYCSGKFRLGDRQFRCWQKYGHGSVNLISALKDSCDVYFYQVGLKVGIDDLIKWGVKMGLGSLSGIDLPGELSGNLAGRDWKKKNLGENWYPGDTVNYSIGQGFLLVTPIQLARMYAFIANEGTIVKPHLTRGSIIETRSTPLNKEHIRLVKRGLDEVVRKGTGAAAGQYEVSIAGKTGTIQNPHGPDHACFAGYAPADVPRFAAVVMVEAGEHGSTVAAPIVGEILAYLLQHYGKI